jgi:SAM-dependent methyltransferase
MYANKDYEAEAQAVARLAAAHFGDVNNRTLLDVACGTGRHIAPFEYAGFDVSGSDLSAEMLSVAQANFPHADLRVGDYASVQFGRTFDVVVCLFGSIGYAGRVERLHAALANMVQHTSPGGMIVIEPWIFADEFSVGRPHMRTGQTADAAVARLNTNRLEDGLAILEFHHLIATADGVEHFVERHELGLFTEQDYLDGLRTANVVSVHMDAVYGDHRRLFVIQR